MRNKKSLRSIFYAFEKDKTFWVLFALILIFPQLKASEKIIDNNFSYVQQTKKNISGVVIDANGMVLPGVSVLVAGKSVGTMTDFDGAFSIQVSKGDVLEFSYVGLETQRITFSDQKELSVILKEATNVLDEIVVVGYGTEKKADLTGAIASVKSETITAANAGTLEQALSGQVAGVIINSSDNSPGAGMAITIRGTSSINASSAPLYVIDGFPIEGELDQGGITESAGQSPLSGIDPNDIESIDILKDASATAIYGARGANGVVIVTTKSAKDGKLSLNFSSFAGVSQHIEAYEARNTLQFAKYQHDRYFPFAQRDTPDPEHEQIRYYEYETYKDSVSTNWMDEVTRLGEVQSYNLSASGGTTKNNFMGSIGYYKNKGIVKHTDFSRVTGNFKARSKPFDWMMLDFNTRFSNSDNNGTVSTNSDGSATYSGIFQQAIRTTPLKFPGEEFVDGNDTDGVTGNPLSILEQVDMLRTSFQSFNNFSVLLTPLKGLQIKSMIGLKFLRDDFYQYAPSTTTWGSNSNGKAKIQNRKTNSWLNENTIQYSKYINKHSITGLVGFSTQYEYRFMNEMNATNFPVENLGYNFISGGEDFSKPFSTAQEYTLMSYFGRLNYNYKGKYLLTASFRADGSSKFAKNNKWGYFPSFALGWKINEENFLKEVSFINQLKLRAGWGKTGNPNIPPYLSLSNFRLTSYPSGETLTTGVIPLNAANPNLKWETSVQSNIGIDFSAFESRLNINVDAYLKNTNDLLIEAEMPPSIGYPTYLYNSGQIRNSGLEFAVNSTLLDKEVNWTAGFNMSFNRNEVISLGDLTTSSWINVPGTKNYNTAILQEGSQIGLWYGYVTEGVLQQDTFDWDSGTNKYVKTGDTPAILEGQQPGSWKFKDLNGDGVINAKDKTVIGNSQPKFTGGFNTRLAYKNFDFSVFLEGSYGRDVYNGNNRFYIEPANSGANGIVADYWRPVVYELDQNGLETDVVIDPGNPNGKYPGAGKGDPFIDMHDAYIENGSYLRIKNIILGYTFEKVKIKSLRVYVNVTNLHTFTNYSGYDPNINAQSLGGLRPGYDFSSYPLARTFSVGLSANL